MASIVVLGFVVGGAFYGLYLGTPIPDQNKFLYPTLLVGLTLLIAASAWKRRFVAQTG